MSIIDTCIPHHPSLLDIERARTEPAPPCSPDEPGQHLVVRIERQSERARRWAGHAYVLLCRLDRLRAVAEHRHEQVLALRRADRSAELRAAQERIDVLVEALERQNERISDLIRERNVAHRALMEEQRYVERLRDIPGVKAAIRRGEQQQRAQGAKRRREAIARRRAKALALADEWRRELRNSNTVPASLARAIRREVGVTGHYDVVLRRGNDRVITSEPAWHETTGGTRVYHPNAYGWPTIRHPAVLRVDVGRGWLSRRLARLARAECRC